MPASSIPFLAWAATAAELVLGVLLLSAMAAWTALASALLLIILGPRWPYPLAPSRRSIIRFSLRPPQPVLLALNRPSSQTI